MPQRGSLEELLGQQMGPALSGMAMTPNEQASLEAMVRAMMGSLGRPLRDQLRPRGEHEYWWNGEVTRGLQAPTRDHYRIVRNTAELNESIRAGEPPLFWQGEGVPNIEQANEAMRTWNEDPATAWWERRGVGPQAPMVRR